MAQDRLKKVKGIADIVFLVDVSGSMQPCIDALKANLATFIGTLSAGGANQGPAVADWRIKVVGYRDVDADGDQWLVDSPFVRGLDQVQTGLAALEAAGGGDEPESLLDALYKVAKLPVSEEGAEDPNAWRDRHAARRFVVFFTDATFKTTMTIPEGRGGSVDDVIRELQAAKIVMHGYCPEADCYQPLTQVDKCEINFVGSLTGAQAALASFTADTANFKRALEVLAKTISVSTDVVAVA